MYDWLLYMYQNGNLTDAQIDKAVTKIWISFEEATVIKNSKSATAA